MLADGAPRRGADMESTQQKKPTDIVKEYFPDSSDEVAENIWPMFPDDSAGGSLEECLRRELEAVRGDK